MENFIAGAFGGLACVAAGQPLDTIKVKMQTYPHIYTSLYRSVKKTLVEEKLRGFYAGAVPAIVSNVAENAVLFLCYNHCQTAVQWAAGVESRADMSLQHLALSGSLASFFSAAAVSPCELIKCKMQTSKLSGCTTTTPTEAVKSILKVDGVMGMYRGLTSTWAREMPGYFCFFTGYNASIKLLTPEGESPENLSRFLELTAVCRIIGSTSRLVCGPKYSWLNQNLWQYGEYVTLSFVYILVTVQFGLLGKESIETRYM